MNKSTQNNTQDPYSQAITSLVKKTLIVLGIVVGIGAFSIGYFALNSGVKVSSAKKNPIVTEEPSTEVLAAVTEVNSTPVVQTPSPTTVPSSSIPSAVPSSVPVATATPSPTPLPTQNSPIPSTSSQNTLSPRAITITATAALDGYIDSKGSVTQSSEIIVGTSQSGVIRGFVSFDISALDVDTVKRVNLRVYQKTGKGNPFGTGSDIRGDLLNYGSSLDASDFSAASLNPSFIIISSSNTEGWREVDVTDAVSKAKKDGRSTIQIRLHLSTESGTREAHASYESAENTLGTTNRPQLLIEQK